MSWLSLNGALFRPPSPRKEDVPEYLKHGIAYNIYFPEKDPSNMQYRVLFLHGNGSSIGTPINSFAAQRIASDLQAEVYLFDYPGYGKSAPLGSSITVDHCESATRYMLTSVVKENSLTQNKPLILIGHSLGASVIFRLLAKDPYLMKSVAMIVSIAAMTSPFATCSKFAGKFSAWFDWYNTIDDAEQVIANHPNVSYLNVHGLNDADVDISHQHAYQQMCAKNHFKNCHWLPVSGATHNGILGPEYIECITSKINLLLTNATTGQTEDQDDTYDSDVDSDQEE